VGQKTRGLLRFAPGNNRAPAARAESEEARALRRAAPNVLAAPTCTTTASRGATCRGRGWSAMRTGARRGQGRGAKLRGARSKRVEQVCGAENQGLASLRPWQQSCARGAGGKRRGAGVEACCTKRVGCANMHHDGVARRDLSWAWMERAIEGDDASDGGRTAGAWTPRLAREKAPRPSVAEQTLERATPRTVVRRCVTPRCRGTPRAHRVRPPDRCDRSSQ
jgi:hypothetical protein